MVKIPHIKIPSVRVGGIDPTSDIGTAIGGVQPTPITYLTQWKIVGNSEVKTLPYPDGVVLPTGYKRCEYLTFDGSSYIDTGIIPEQGIAVSVNCEFTALGDKDYGLLGCREGAFSSDSLYSLNQRTNQQIIASYGGAALAQVSPSNPSISINQRVFITLDSSKVEIVANGNTFVQPHTRSIVKGDKSIHIGQVYNSGYAKYVGKIYSIRMSLSDALVFNGIPCLDDNDVPCLYDTVSQTTLYNQGTGTFGYELYPQPTEIWSCGEYNPMDGKYHILVQPLGGSIADIALTEPLRKVNDVADSIEFANGVAVVTRNIQSMLLKNLVFNYNSNRLSFDAAYSLNREFVNVAYVTNNVENMLTAEYEWIAWQQAATNNTKDMKIMMSNKGDVKVRDLRYDNTTDFYAHIDSFLLFFILATPTTELVDAPQIAEAESYSCVISQGGKAVEWSSFTTDSSE